MNLFSKLTDRALVYYDNSPLVVQRFTKNIIRIVFKCIYHIGTMRASSKLPIRIFLIDSKDILYISDSTRNSDIFSKYFSHGTVLSGDWDKKRTLLMDDTMYKFGEDVFLNGLPYESTQFYKEVMDQQRERYIKNKQQLETRLNNWKILYNSIRTHGFKSQKSLTNSELLDEICISIDRDGNKILEDGRHRFIIAHLLNLKDIPVIVNRVHGDYWSRHKEELLSGSF